MNNLLDFLQETVRTGKTPRDKSALNNLIQDIINYKNYRGPAEIIPNAPIDMPNNFAFPIDTPPDVTDLDFGNYPIQAPTINNAPPVGQSGNVEPLPFFKYQPPVGQDTINFYPRNPDPRITIDEAPPVQKYNYPDINLNGIDANSLASVLKFLQEQGYREY